MKRSWSWVLPVLLITAGVAVGLIAPPLAPPHGHTTTTAAPLSGGATSARATR